jgi:hypothetical protein
MTMSKDGKPVSTAATTAMAAAVSVAGFETAALLLATSQSQPVPS